MKSLVRPYGLVASSFVVGASVMGRVSGSPYTVAEDEKTNSRTSCLRSSLSSVVVEPMLFS